MLSPLLYSLYAYDCIPPHSANTIVKFAHDITVTLSSSKGGTCPLHIKGEMVERIEDEKLLKARTDIEQFSCIGAAKKKEVVMTPLYTVQSIPNCTGLIKRLPINPST